MNEQLVVDDLKFEVRRSARRKTLELTVDRGGELRVAAPPHAGGERLERFVRDNLFWLYTKLAEKDLLKKPMAQREFVSGEGFSYLGRSYRLLLVDEQDVPLKLVGGRFRLRRSLARRGRDEIVRWYVQRAQAWLALRVAAWAQRMGVKPTAVGVRDLGFRWGSCGSGGGVNFHWATILLPPSIVDYVIVHELAHLREANHTPVFWRIVTRALPDQGERRAWLAEHGGQFTAW